MQKKHVLIWVKIGVCQQRKNLVFYTEIGKKLVGFRQATTGVLQRPMIQMRGDITSASA